MDALTHDKRFRTHDIAVRPGFTTLYDLIAAVGDAVAPGNEAWIAPTVKHVLRSGHARFLQDIDTDDIDGQEAEPAWSDAMMAEEVPADLTVALAGEDVPATVRETLTAVAAYLTKHRDHMNYAAYKE